MKCKLNLLIWICLFFKIDASSQENKSIQYDKSYWIDFGAGWSGRDRAGTVSLNFEVDKRFLLTFSYDKAYYPTGIQEIASVFTLGFIPVEYKPGFDTQAISLKVGKIVKSDWGLITCSAGISSVKATQYSRTGPLGSTATAGASFDVKFIAAAKFAGLGFNPFFNLNKIQSYGGLTVILALGKVNYIR